MTLSDVMPLPVSYLVLVFIAAGARFMLTKEAPTIKLLIATLICSIAVTMASHEALVGWLTDKDSKELNKGLLTAVTALSAFAAKDILEGILKLGDQIKSDPLAFLREWLNRNKPGDNQ